MSNPNINKQDEHLNTAQNDLRIKRNICLFNFSNLKTSSRLSLSEFNSFKYDLSRKQQSKFGSISNNHFLRRNESAYIKNIAINIPSAEKLSNDEFKIDFIKDFDESFAHFCGLNKKQYINAFINNTYIPKLNEIGNLNISINNIFEILKTYSDSKRVKISRKLIKANRIKRRARAKIKISKNLINKSKNIFQVLPKNDGKEILQIDLKNEDNNFDDLEEIGNLENDNKNKDRLINNFENTPSLISIEYENQNAPKSKTLLNIKRNLKNISIPASNNCALKNQNHISVFTIKDLSNSSLEQKNKLNSKNLIFNNNNLLINNNSNDNKKLAYNASQIMPLNSCQKCISSNLLSHKQQHNSNDNVFSFSSNILQNYDSNSQNKSKNEISQKHLDSPFNDSNANNNLNLNSPPIIRPILNSGIFSPNLDNNILSPNSYLFSKSNISSPLLLNASPFNNNVFFNDAFNFNNVNTSAFIFGHNKSENSINICGNNNINGNNDKSNDDEEIMYIHDKERKDNGKNERSNNNVNLNNNL